MHYQRFRYQGKLDEVAPPKARQCVVCGTSLEGREFRSVFCSRTCSDRSRTALRQSARASRTDACLQCGLALAGKRADAQFCSDKCSQDHRNAGIAARLRANRKPCVHCGKPIPLKRHRFCSDACTLAHRRPEKYGLSRDELAALLAQHGVCAICGTDAWGFRGPNVDHDHATGRIRGVLCSKCNQALGLLDDNADRLRAAAEYLSMR